MAGKISHQVVESDMADELRETALKIFADATQHWESESKMATAVKTALDKETPNGRWNCLVGKSFASYFSHDAETFLQAKMVKETEAGEQSKLIIVFRAS